MKDIKWLNIAIYNLTQFFVPIALSYYLVVNHSFNSFLYDYHFKILTNNIIFLDNTQ